MQRQNFITTDHRNLTIDVVHAPMPAGHDYYSDSDLDSYQIESWKTMKVFGYWYGHGSYEGTGYAIYQCGDGKWDQAGLSHCSCYGPMDNINDNLTGVYNTLDELVATFSEELKASTKGIYDALKLKGY